MSFLVNQFRSEANKLKDERIKAEANFDVGYSTGFLSLDFINGAVIHVKSEERNFAYNSIGLVDGSANTFIGRSGCGKTTLILQIAANIVRPFENSAIYFDSLEGGVSSSSFETLFQMSSDEYQKKLVYRNTGITAENFYQRIRMIHDIKLAHMSEFEYDTGLYDSLGKRIFKLQPTVYILDSIPMLMPDKITEREEMDEKGVDATKMAKSNTNLFKSIVPLLKMANIILLVVNHILDDVQMGMFPKKPQIAGLKVGETLPGGKAATYLANNMFRMDDNKKLKEAEGLGIDGAIVDVMVVKSRTNKSLRAVPLVLNFDTGFDNILSLFMLLKQHGVIEGSASYHFTGSDIKFTQKNFKEKLAENPDLQKIFSELSYQVLSSYLSDRSDFSNKKVFNINDMILSNAA